MPPQSRSRMGAPSFWDVVAGSLPGQKEKPGLQKPGMLNLEI